MSSELELISATTSRCFQLALSPELQSYSVLKLFFAAKENPSEEILIQVAIWAIGEYGDLLVAGKEAGPDGSQIQVCVMVTLCIICTQVSSTDVLNFLQNCGKLNGFDMASSGGGLLIGGSTLLEGPAAGSSPMLELLTTAMVKLSTRLPNERNRIQKILRQFQTSKTDR